MANEIRIHLATYLKDAGIKATQAQVEKLAQSIQKTNASIASSSDQSAQRLGRLEGAFGKLQGVVSGFGAKAMAVIGAFKVGWDIGKWLQTNVIDKLFGLTDPIENLKKHNRELKRQADEAAKAWGVALADWAEGWEKEVRGADNARQKVEDLTKAYLQMAEARERVAKAQGDSQSLQLERDKFEDILSVSRNGTPEQVEQVSKYYDVLAAEEKQRQTLAKYDRDAEAAAQKQLAAQQAINAQYDKRDALERQRMELETKLEYLQETGGGMGADQYTRAESDLQNRLKAINREIDATTRDINSREADYAAGEVSAAALAQERDNARERSEIEIDQRKKAYDDYLDYVAQMEREEQERRRQAMRDAIEAEKAERLRMEQELAQKRIADLRDELAERQRAEGDARSRQSAAAGSLSQAWGWYRNQSSMQAVIDEQKAQAAAEVQWQKDFERLKTWRRDWRTADFGSLSAADEAVRQVAFAKEEKAAADKAVIETAENTRNLAEKLDELLQAKG